MNYVKNKTCVFLNKTEIRNRVGIYCVPLPSKVTQNILSQNK